MKLHINCIAKINVTLAIMNTCADKKHIRDKALIQLNHELKKYGIQVNSIKQGILDIEEIEK